MRVESECQSSYNANPETQHPLSAVSLSGGSVTNHYL